MLCMGKRQPLAGSPTTRHGQKPPESMIRASAAGVHLAAQIVNLARFARPKGDPTKRSVSTECRECDTSRMARNLTISRMKQLKPAEILLARAFAIVLWFLISVNVLTNNKPQES